jgi:CheY-like chemotaxis protein
MNGEIRIILIDDEDEERFFFLAAVKLIQSPVKCRAYQGGREALEALSDPSMLPPHFIFIDMNMPQMDGKECLQKIRLIEGMANIPVVLYSGYPSHYISDNVDKPETPGSTLFLQKQQTIKELTKAVVDIILSHPVHKESINPV